MNNELIFLNPVFTHNIWGGTRLHDDFHYDIEGNDIGECWGISAHQNGEGTVRAGIFHGKDLAGKKLSDLWKQEPELFGNFPSDRFPLLIKIIDAKEDLSIQVHPNDAYAKVHENGSFGKTECWYVLDCAPNSTLVIGHNAGTKEELTDMIHNGRWKEFIREIPVQKGDFIQINPGTVHAIKGGILLLETQQNSDITYRVYDYDRLSGGKPRQLHISQSIDVITVPAASVEHSIVHARNLSKNQFQVLEKCDYYRVGRIDLDGTLSMQMDAPFFAASVVSGQGTVNKESVKAGDHFLVPASVKELTFEGEMELILSNP